jgi:uncharacterized OB-fold protein
MGSRVITEPFRRITPELTSRNEHFWLGGRAGVLQILRCESCQLYVHPPAPVCRRCGSMQLSPQAVSGKGIVYSYTINHYRWNEELDPPYVVAQVDLVEQEGLRLMTNIVDCAIDDVEIGMPVEVVFARHGDVYVPLFTPAAPE